MTAGAYSKTSLARAEAARTMILHWPEAEGRVVTAQDFVEIARKDAGWRRTLTMWCPPRRGEELPSTRSVGRALAAVRGVAIEGYVIEVVKRTKQGALWARLVVSTP